MLFGETKSVWQRGLLVAVLLTAAAMVMSCGKNESLAATNTPPDCQSTAAGNSCSCKPDQDCIVNVLCTQPMMQALVIPTVAPPNNDTVSVKFQLTGCRFKDFAIKDKNGVYPAQGWNGQTYSQNDHAVTYTYDGRAIDDQFMYNTDFTGARTKDGGSGTIRNQ